MAVLQIVFSPTGGTENCAYIVATTLNSNAETIDLTDRAVDFTKVVVAPEDVCVIAVPSFGGRVPAVALERLAQIKGNGAKAILMAVYGNREIDDTLLELKEVAENAGFKLSLPSVPWQKILWFPNLQLIVLMCKTKWNWNASQLKLLLALQLAYLKK